MATNHAISVQEITEILLENYYTLATTGAQALEAVWGDISNGNFADQISEWGSSMGQLIEAVNDMTTYLDKSGFLFREAHTTSLGLFR
jgi:uncharacterized protein YukE